MKPFRIDAKKPEHLEKIDPQYYYRVTVDYKRDDVKLIQHIFRTNDLENDRKNAINFYIKNLSIYITQKNPTEQEFYSNMQFWQSKPLLKSVDLDFIVEYTKEYGFVYELTGFSVYDIDDALAAERGIRKQKSNPDAGGDATIIKYVNE